MDDGSEISRNTGLTSNVEISVENIFPHV